MEEPAREGGRVKIRLSPHGQLTVFSDSAIDWEATKRFNAPPPAPTPAAPSRSSAVDGGLSITTKAHARLGGPVEISIIGSKGSVSGATTGEGGDAATGTTPPATLDPAQTAVQLAQLGRQMAIMKNTYNQTVMQRTGLETRLAELQQRVAKEPPASGLQSYETPSRKALALVQSQLAAAREQISALERRMNDIRFQAVQLGGILD